MPQPRPSNATVIEQIKADVAWTQPSLMHRPLARLTAMTPDMMVQKNIEGDVWKQTSKQKMHFPGCVLCPLYKWSSRRSAQKSVEKKKPPANPTTGSAQNQHPVGGRLC